MSHAKNTFEPVAIAGMSCRLPGGITNLEEFWELLMDGRDGYSEFPESRIKVDSWYHPDTLRPGSIVSRGGAFIRHDINEFDNNFFGISAVESSFMDPAQKQLLEVAYEACESAGLTIEELRGSKTGVYVGNFGLGQSVMSQGEAEYVHTYTSTGSGNTILSNRISYVLDLKGPSFTLDTACSSSLYALHLACMGLLNGDCSAAVVCAPNIIHSIEAQLMSSKLGAISPTSRCHTFDESADGYARADGIGAVYLMPLSDAIRLRRPVRAVIRGTAIGANGHGSGLTHPEAEGQAAVISQAYKVAGNLDLSETTYFECHGTGTPVGDPIETRAIGKVFSTSRPLNNHLLIGSVKSNLGHSEAAAGITALIKTVLAIEKGMIPPTIGVDNINHALKLEEWRLKIVTEATPWPSDIPCRRASVNSFGYGGANAHVILEGIDTVMPWFKADVLDLADSSSEGLRTSNSPLHSSVLQSNERGDRDADTPTLIFCSAASKISLKQTIGIVKEQLLKHSAEDVGYTLARRSNFSHRAMAVVEKGIEPTFNIGEAVVGNKLGFIFTGQGAQWSRMGNDLLKIEAFLDSIQRSDSALALLPVRPSWTIQGKIEGDLSSDEMDEPLVAQLITTAVEMAIVDLLASWNIVPSVVTGHSSGAIAAGYAAGYLSRAEAISVAYYRGEAVSQTKQDLGAMLAVGLSAEEAEVLIPAGATVVVGAVNSLRSVTLSGSREAIYLIKEELDTRNIFNRILATRGTAYHSPYMKKCAAAYSALLNTIVRSTEQASLHAQYISTLTGELWTDSEIPMSYWCRNMVSPVLFSDAMTIMLDAGVTHGMEIGPHSALKAPILDIATISLSENPFKYLSTLKRRDNSVKCLLQSVGELALAGYGINMPHINAKGSLLLDFPSYRWDHSRIISVGNRSDHEWRFRRFPRHDLLGSLTPGSALSVQIWRNIISLRSVPWLADHMVGGRYVFPAAGFISMGLEAMRQVGQTVSEVFILEDVYIADVMILDDELEVFLTMQRQDLGNSSSSRVWWEFNVSSVKAGRSTEHAKGLISSVSRTQYHNPEKSSSADLSNGRLVSPSSWYDETAVGKGVIFGPSFKRLSQIYTAAEQQRATATVVLENPPDITGLSHESPYVIHPTILDNCFQLSVLAAGTSESDQAYVPRSIDGITIFKSSANQHQGTVEAGGHFIGFRTIRGYSKLVNPSGEVMVDIQGLRLIGTSAGKDKVSDTKREAFWRLVWDDDYDAITCENEKLYFLAAEPKNSKYKPSEFRPRLAYWTQMLVTQFAQKYPHLMVQEPINDDNKHFIGWCHWIVQNTKITYPVMYAMSLQEREHEIESAGQSLPEIGEWTLALYSNLDRIISGQISVLDIAMADDHLRKFYANHLLYGKFERVVEVLCFKNPAMRILEIGAGTGSATNVALRALTRQESKMYSSYVYTDISPSFFLHASTKFSHYKDIEYKAYDMERGPEEQNFEAQSFDLVFASCAVHVTSNIINALKNIRRLLKPDGKLLLFEITAEWSFQTFNMGLLPGFYKGYNDGRTRHPFWTTEQWAEALPAAGFSKPEILTNDTPENHAFTVITASVVPIISSPDVVKREKTITVVHWLDPTCVSSHVEALAKERGYSVNHRGFVEDRSISSAEWDGSGRIIVLAELERPLWKTVEPSTWLEFQRMTQKANSILWVTQGGLMAGNEPEAGIVNGFFQCLDINPRVRAASMDFETSSPRDRSMAEQILYYENILPNGMDKQYRQHKGRWLISRLLPDQRLIEDFARSHGKDRSAINAPLKDLGPIRIATTDPGRLSALVFRPDKTLHSPLEPDHIEIKVRAVGMNMMEISALTGAYDTDSFSSEFSGTVTLVGKGVKNFEVGDRVFGMFGGGRFGNYSRVPANVCQKALSDDAFQSVASLPSCYCTAFYALVEIGRITPGQTVLIQNATGGLGMAAIAIARLYDAEIYATAGTDEKRATLREMGIPSDHIFSSRELSAYHEMKAATRGKGFELVLNTSTGDYLHHVSWPSVAPFGKFVELKKNDIVDGGRLSMKKFNDGVSFIPIDMHYVCKHRPEVLVNLMEIVGSLYQNGRIKPLPVTTFPVSRISQAYEEFTKFTHTGKLVLLYEGSDKIPYLPSPNMPKFSSNAAYLIVGGLASGAGSLLGEWMVRRGAQNLIFLSRSSVEGLAQDTVDRIRSLGATVYTVKGNVSNRKDVHRALTCSQLPIQGIINAALVLRNKDIYRLSCNEVQETFEAKIEGNISLHEVSTELCCPLDFFVMLSSLLSISHSASQSSYSAANCFMNDFERYRRRQGLPATSINLGVIEDVGFMSRNKDNMIHLTRNGHYATTGEELIRQFETSLFRHEPAGAWGINDTLVLGTEPRLIREVMDSEDVPVAPWDRDPRWMVIGVHVRRLYQSSHASQAGGKPKGGIKDLIISRLAKLLWIPEENLQLHKSLFSLGIDSMIAAEFRHWIYQTFKKDMNMIELVAQDMTIEKLAESIKE